MQTQVIVHTSPKNETLGAVLGFFFGPLGLLYSSSYIAAGVFFVANVISFLLTPFLIGFPMLFGCAVGAAFWNYKACKKINQSNAAPAAPIHFSKTA